jgi:hypothetical protein
MVPALVPGPEQERWGSQARITEAQAVEEPEQVA